MRTGAKDAICMAGNGMVSVRDNAEQMPEGAEATSCPH